MKKTGSFNLSQSHEENDVSSVNTISRHISNSDNTCRNVDSKEPTWKCRYVITLVGFLIHLITSTHRTIMSIAIVAMVNHTALDKKTKAKSDSCPDLVMNFTENETTYSFKTEGEFAWSPEMQGYILSALFFGSFITFIISGRMAERYGCKWIIVGSLLTLSILTMSLPPLSYSASIVIVIQVLRGLLLGLPGPCITILIANWSPKNERGFLFSLIQPAHSLGPALGHIFSGYISESPAGWPYAFYITGAVGLVMVIYIIFFLAEYPNEHPRISKAELDYILSEQESKLSKRRPKLPWRQILTSVPFYAATFTTFGRVWAFSQFWIVHSTFLGTILHYPIGQNGLFSAMPFLLAFVTALIASWISGTIEKKKMISVDYLRKFWIIISCSLFALCLLGMYLAGCNSDLSATFSVLSMGFLGIGTPGTFIVIQDMSPTFAGTLYSLTTTIGSLAPVILPLVVGHLTTEMQTLEQWNKVFFISIGMVMFSAVVFLFFGSAKIQPWNFVEEKLKNNDKQHAANNIDKEESQF